jgi:NADH:ubiquinone oxidoreductase subunit B-like Fe-S oxidoreductase
VKVIAAYFISDKAETLVSVGVFIAGCPFTFDKFNQKHAAFAQSVSL